MSWRSLPREMQWFLIGLSAAALLALAGFVLLMRLIDTLAAERAAPMAKDIVQTRLAVEPPPPHHTDAIDAVIMGLVTERERMDEKIARLQHVANGGRWDDSPTRWKKESA